MLEEQLHRIAEDLKTRIPGVVGRTFGTTVGTTVSLLTTMVLVTIFVIFLLAGRNPHAIRQGIYAEIDQKIRSYLSTKILLSGLTGILVWVALAMLGLEMAGVFGLLAFLLNFIPSIGSVIATLLPIPIAIAQFGQLWPVIAVIAIPGAIQMGIGNGLEPKLMGTELQLHPVAILLALSFWGLLWGPIGMLLAVPITASLRIVLLRFETTQPVAGLLAGQLPGGGAGPTEA
jgi:AI-2 transport protein TqsA